MRRVQRAAAVCVRAAPLAENPPEPRLKPSRARLAVEELQRLVQQLLQHDQLVGRGRGARLQVLVGGEGEALREQRRCFGRWLFTRHRNIGCIFVYARRQMGLLPHDFSRHGRLLYRWQKLN